MKYIVLFLEGLILFFFGFKTINDILKNTNRNYIKNIISKNHTTFKGLIKGFFITIIINSSSFVTVLLTSLVDNKILTLYESSSLIMGSNIGTCLTGFFLAGLLSSSINIFNEDFLLIILILLFLFFAIKKKEKIKTFIIGLIIIMLSMNLISESSLILQNIKNLDTYLEFMQNPLIGILSGTILTFIFQSSSLITGILCTITLHTPFSTLSGIHLILGSNIGTCGTAIMSGLKTSSNAKKVGIYHLLFNIIGSVFFLISIYLIIYFTKYKFNNDLSLFGVAIINTIFNIFSTIFLLPLNKKIVELCDYLIK